MSKFSKKEVINSGWETTKQNFFFFVKLLLIIGIINFIGAIISEQLKGTGPTFNVLGTIVVWLIQTVVAMGFIKITLDFVDNRKPILLQLYNQYPLFLNYIAGAIVSALIVLVGILLLIIPGIIFSIRLQFVSFLILDKKLGPIEAIKESWKITKNQVWNLLLLGIVLGLINLAGFLTLIIGLFWTIPTTSLATAFVYKKLAKS